MTWPNPNNELPKRSLKALMEIFVVSVKLGLTSFGGPIAHLGYFHNEYIRKRQWMDERSYADLVALCQFIPGPASSQVGIGIGTMRAGLLGGLIAWLGFTLPSVIALVVFAYVLTGLDISQVGWIHGLKIVAVAIVAQAILGMGQKLAPDKIRASIAIAVAVISLLWQSVFSQAALIISAGLMGLVISRNTEVQDAPALNVPITRTFAAFCLTLFFGLLIALPILRHHSSSEWVALFDSFYRSGSIVFGGGHVVLPILEQEVVPPGWISKEDFLAGYGAAQAVPGPLFTFAAYLGAMTKGVFGAILATIAIFLPAFLLILGTLPFWSALRNNRHIGAALVGINAAVVGILLAALYNPLWTTAIIDSADFALASILFLLLVFWKLPPWTIVMAGMIGGTLLELF